MDSSAVHAVIAIGFGFVLEPAYANYHRVDGRPVHPTRHFVTVYPTISDAVRDPYVFHLARVLQHDAWHATLPRLGHVQDPAAHPAQSSPAASCRHSVTEPAQRMRSCVGADVHGDGRRS